MNSINVVPFPTLHLIRISGEKSSSFLQGQLTCDVTRVTSTTAVNAAYCNLQGRVFANGVLWLWGTDYYLWLPESSALPVVERLQKYAQFSKVLVSDVSTQFSGLGLFGPGLAGSTELSVTSNAVETRITLPGARQCRFTALPAPTDPLEKGWTRATENDWKTLAINQGEAHITDETRELFLPHELQYQRLDMISFEKGCYLGQEIIARMHYRGKSKVRLYRIAFESQSAPPLGSLITTIDGQALGRLVNCIQQPDATFLGLAILPLESGTELRACFGPDWLACDLRLTPV
jgi:folate-binding protein YgfZ